MMRSMYAAVSGLRNHQTRMDVIGNNIANVNTTGFKKSRVTFKDAFSQVLKGASRPEGGLGGTNPMQVGMGMVLGSIDVIHTKGNAQGTGKMTDLCIDGEGFFILNSGTGSLYYSRAGAFDFDREGNFINPDGMIVQGWYLNEYGERLRSRTDNTIDPAAPPSNLALIHQLTPPQATSSVVLSGNLHDGTAPDESFSRTFTVYDQKGNPYDVQIEFEPGASLPAPPENEFENAFSAWTWSIPGVEGTLVFDAAGNILGVTVDENDNEAEVTGTTVKLTFDPDKESTGDECVQVFDFSGITQYADPRGESIISVQQDGYTYGRLEELVVDDKGVISGSFSNGTSRPLLQVAIATFGNPAGLIGRGNSLFALSNNSGEPQIDAPGTGMAGAVSPSSLEMSNVDLSEEFTDMIVTQRGFQANSRVITASDEMLQELVNMKR
ncbi:MAG: flagellar hook protein FlgE [Firmicutes bacterium]|nr:flagellar hook protein FlgE [Bacillota bacterium]